MPNSHTKRSNAFFDIQQILKISLFAIRSLLNVKGKHVKASVSPITTKGASRESRGIFALVVLENQTVKSCHLFCYDLHECSMTAIILMLGMFICVYVFIPTGFLPGHVCK